MNPARRPWVVGAGVAALAASAGVGWALWREQAAAAASAADGADGGLWQRSFERIDPPGGTLQMAALRGRPLVLNFWATWCAPCIEEMPQLDRFHRDFASRGWQVVGLAIDAAPAVREFLLRTPVSFAIGLAQADGVSLARQLGNQAGGLPFSVVFNRDGRPIQRQVGKTSYQQLAAWAAGPL